MGTRIKGKILKEFFLSVGEQRMKYFLAVQADLQGLEYQLT